MRHKFNLEAHGLQQQGTTSHPEAAAHKSFCMQFSHLLIGILRSDRAVFKASAFIRYRVVVEVQCVLGQSLLFYIRYFINMALTDTEIKKKSNFFLHCIEINILLQYI